MPYFRQIIQISLLCGVATARLGQTHDRLLNTVTDESQLSDLESNRLEEQAKSEELQTHAEQTAEELELGEAEEEYFENELHGNIEDGTSVSESSEDGSDYYDEVVMVELESDLDTVDEYVPTSPEAAALEAEAEKIAQTSIPTEIIEEEVIDAAALEAMIVQIEKTSIPTEIIEEVIFDDEMDSEEEDELIAQANEEFNGADISPDMLASVMGVTSISSTNNETTSVPTTSNTLDFDEDDEEFWDDNVENATSVPTTSNTLDFDGDDEEIWYDNIEYATSSPTNTTVPTKSFDGEDDDTTEGSSSPAPTEGISEEVSDYWFDDDAPANGVEFDAADDLPVDTPIPTSVFMGGV